jgi:hypothetical protein
MSDGETPQEAVDNVIDAIACWIEAAEEDGRPRRARLRFQPPPRHRTPRGRARSVPATPSRLPGRPEMVYRPPLKGVAIGQPPMMHLCDVGKFARFAAFVAAVSLAPMSHAVTPPVGDGSTPDAKAINAALKAVAASCGTVTLQCTNKNQFAVENTIHVPACVRLIGVCGAVPGEGKNDGTVGTTLLWKPSSPSVAGPVVRFHDSPGASLSGVSIDCQNQSGAIGIQYDSDDKPTASFVNIDTLMIRGCHQGLVVGLAGNTAAVSCPPPLPNSPALPGCGQSDQLKFERFRILGNLSDPTGEGIHINSANAAQGSLIFDGNIQGVNLGFHIISTNGGLIIENTNYTSSSVGTAAAFIRIEPTVAVSPTVINDEVEGSNAAVIDHGCNGTPGNPVWLNNAWNNHQVIVDGNENITSIGTVLNQATLSSSTSCTSAPHVVSINENGWRTAGTVTSANLTMIGAGVAMFGPSLIDQDVVEAAGPACTSVPPGTKPGYFPNGVENGDLVACRGAHSGRLWLGKDLMLTNGGAGAAGRGTLSIQAGVDPDGGGLKHQTVSTGSIPAGGAAIVTLTWHTAFPDSNYQAICTVQDNTGSLQLINTSVPAPGQVNTEVKNNDAANPHAGSLACVAIHD